MIIEIQTALIAFVGIFIMELGDKTQLASFTLACRYRRPVLVFLGVIFGLFLVSLIGAALGTILQIAIPNILVRLVAGLLFILIGAFGFFQILRTRIKTSQSGSLDLDNVEGCEEPEEVNDLHWFSVVLGASILIFLAELGDKTQFTVFLLASVPGNNPIFVLLGSMFAFGLVNGLAILIGDRLAHWIPRSKLDILVNALFILCGILIILFG